jgi:hypothetical protein
MVAVMASGLGGCTTHDEPGPVRVSAAPSAVVTVSDPDSDDPQQVVSRSPDGYPNFAGALTAASPQMSNEEAADISARLSALGVRRRTGAISQAEYIRQRDELRKLGAEHGANAEAAIGN